MLPSSRFALSLKPNVAYLVLNFAAAWKKQTTLSSLAYAGIPYQSLGVRVGALSLMIVWSRLAMVRSRSRISAIFASTALSPSPLPAFISWTRSLIAPRSSSVNALLVVVVLLADLCVPFRAGFMEFDSSFQSLSIFFTSSFQALQPASLGLCCQDWSLPRASLSSRFAGAVLTSFGVIPEFRIQAGAMSSCFLLSIFSFVFACIDL